jgi:hypothetical protein
MHEEGVVSDDMVLIGDAERDQTLARLREACVDGRLTLDEFAQRADAVLVARNRGQLAPATAGGGGGAPPPRRSVIRRMVAVLGSSKQAGRWRIGEQNTAVAVLGECELDLRRAEVEAADVTIRAYSVLGEVKVIVPEGIDVGLTGWTVLGEKKFDAGDGPVLPGAPVIRLHACVLLGSVKIERPR